MNKDELTFYELPAIASYISIWWIQDLVARYVAYKVNTKYARMIKRIEDAKSIWKDYKVK